MKTKLQIERESYVNLTWRSSKGVETLIHDLDNDYLENVIRYCIKAQLVAERYPNLQFLHEYNGIKYTHYLDACITEYNYRQELKELHIQKYIKTHQINTSKYINKYDLSSVPPKERPNSDYFFQ